MTSNVQSQDLAGIGATTSLAFTDKTKQIADASGFFTKAERVRQSNFVQNAWEPFAVCGGDVETILKNPDNAEFTRSFQALMTLAGAGDFVQVTYALHKNDMELANEFINYARIARATGDQGKAQDYERRAKTIVETGHLCADKIAIVKTSVQKSEISTVNARWIRWDTIAEGKSSTPRSR